jgi:hypothetical protein
MVRDPKIPTALALTVAAHLKLYPTLRNSPVNLADDVT